MPPEPASEDSRRRTRPYDGVWVSRAVEMDEWLRQHKVVVSATSASLISTFTGFPLDSLKSRLQSSREKVSIHRLAADVIREEGIGGLWRGFPLPLITISIVRTVSFTIYTSTKRILNSAPAAVPRQTRHEPSGEKRPERKGGQSVDSNKREPWVDVRLGMFSGDNAKDIGITSLLAGGASGAVVCVGSAPFELVKVRRQLEYQIYRDSHPQLFKEQSHKSDSPLPPRSVVGSSSVSQSSLGSSASHKPNIPNFTPPTTMQAVRLIVSSNGIMGLYTGWRLHFIRDTLGTALYFAEYDVMRYYLGRSKSEQEGRSAGRMDDVQGDVPDWARTWLPKSIIPFLCGSLAGVSSWALIYPVDAIKTKAQQRALSGLAPRTPLYQLQRLVRGIDASNPKTMWQGIARLYRGLGISMVRSMLTHGLLWTIVDAASSYIDTKPFGRMAEAADEQLT
ncbi:uncharacterized protein L203_101306 [Cryptococcus depauperatus CBS 7841]|uniref:Solute carrier family 25 (Mitochondrial carnitine/acylcarnitine transporter), member 20/29 n=1 Tax=Cryptococcus depauperatus CBS 7841 TaxID=1295531 RepID=A0AAJ8LYY3_9TREE